MTAVQARTYLAKARAAERTASLRAMGIAQRLQQLDPRDRETVQSGAPRVGMSADALRFVWGGRRRRRGTCGILWARSWVAARALIPGTSGTAWRCIWPRAKSWGGWISSPKTLGGESAR